MINPSAARLAAQLRVAAKAQSLRNSDLADRVGGLTDRRITDVWVSRRLNGSRPLIRISPDLFVLAAALELDPMDLIEDAVRNASIDPEGIQA